MLTSPPGDRDDNAPLPLWEGLGEGQLGQTWLLPVHPSPFTFHDLGDLGAEIFR
jgi:hypothetical protein